MLSNSWREKMRWILFAVFVIVFCVLTFFTILLIFTGYGATHIEKGERSLLVKVFIGEVGIAIVTLFYSLFGLKRSRKAIELSDVVQGTFLVKTYPRSQHPSFFSEVENLVPKAKEITLIATGLNLIWEKHIVDILIDRAKTEQAKVTICLGNPYSPHVQDRLIEEEMRGVRPAVGQDGIERNAKALLQRLTDAGNPQGISICFFENYPTFATLIFDQEIFVYPYAYQVLGNTSPIFHFRNNDSQEARFFIDNARRILSDAAPAKDVLSAKMDRRYYSDDWIAAAVYIIPDQNEPLYRFGSSVLGYDIFQQTSLKPEIGDFASIRTFVGEAAEYGFHATLADALFFATESEIERVKAELRMLSEDLHPFMLSNFRIRDKFHDDRDIVMLCDDESGITETIHHELLARVYSTAISSTYRAGRTRKRGISSSAERDKLMLNRYGSPYILKWFILHFTLCSAAPCDNGERNEVLNKIQTAFQQSVKTTEIEIDEIYLLTRRDKENCWKIDSKYKLGKI